jgi:hypothetical protein
MMALGAGIFGALACLFVAGGAFAEAGSWLYAVLLAAAAASFAAMFLLLTARARKRN